MNSSWNTRMCPRFKKTVFCALLMAGFVTCHAVAFDSVVLVRPHGETLVYGLDAPDYAFPKGGLSEQLVSGGIAFNITYVDNGVGFTDPATGEAVRNRFKDVLAYVAGVIGYTNRTLDIQVEASEFDGTGALATAGTFFPVAAGFHPGSTLDRLSSGFKPFAGFPEISVTVDVGFAWNVSVGDPGPGEADFFSVLLHEVTHGLGFSSLIEADGTSAIGTGVYTVYDSLLTDGANSQSLLSSGVTPVFQVNTSSLISGDVWFDGPQALARYGVGTPVPVYAPGPYEPGSSISHWDLNTLQGTSVMTHAIILGTTQREYAPADLGALIDLGYNQIDGASSVAPTGCNPGTAKDSTTHRAGGDLVLLGLAGLVLMALRRR